MWAPGAWLDELPRAPDRREVCSERGLSANLSPRGPLAPLRGSPLRLSLCVRAESPIIRG